VVSAAYLVFVTASTPDPTSPVVRSFPGGVSARKHSFIQVLLPEDLLGVFECQPAK